MMAPSYAAKRSSLTKANGLGRKPTPVAAEVGPDMEIEATTAKRAVTKRPGRRVRSAKG